MASLDELDRLEANDKQERRTRLERLRAFGRQRADRLLGTGQGVVIPLAELLHDNPDLERAEAVIAKEEAKARLDALLDSAPEKQTTRIVAPQPVVKTHFNVVRGRVYVYDHLPGGEVVQRDVTDRYMGGTGGRLPEDATRRKLPVAMQQSTQFPCSRTLQTQHDAHCGAVSD